MHLVQLLLPLYDNAGEPFAASEYHAVRAELTGHFGGLTAYARSPAAGLWQDDDGRAVRDDVVVYEVMVDGLDRAWWAAYRESLRVRFRQEELVVRAQQIELL